MGKKFWLPDTMSAEDERVVAAIYALDRTDKEGLAEYMRDPYFATVTVAVQVCGKLKALVEQEAPTKELKVALDNVKLILASLKTQSRWRAYSRKLRNLTP